jgi:hypothetical protein
VKTISISYEVQNSNTYPMHLWLSIPNERLFGSKVQRKQSRDPQYVLPQDFHGNQFAYYFLAPQEKLNFCYEYEARRERNMSLTETERAYYLQSTELTPIDVEIKTKAYEITSHATTDQERAYQLFDYMTKAYRFSLLHELDNYDEYEGLPNGSNYLLQEQVGDSRDFACLYASFCRSLKIPCRVIFGSFVIPTYKVHVWNEVYLTGEGWIPVDPCMGRIQRRQWWLSFFSDCKTLYYKRYFGQLEDVRPIFAIDPDFSRFPREKIEDYRPEEATQLTYPFSWGLSSFGHISYFPPVLSEQVEMERTIVDQSKHILKEYIDNVNFINQLEEESFPGEWSVCFPKWKLMLYQFKNFSLIMLFLVEVPLFFIRTIFFQQELPFVLEFIRQTTLIATFLSLFLLRLRWLIAGCFVLMSLLYLMEQYIGYASF